MPDVISLLINLVLLKLNKAGKNERRTSGIFVSFQDYLSWFPSQKLFSIPKLTSSNDFLISIGAVFTTSILRIDERIHRRELMKKENNDWFFLSGSQNEIKSPNFSIRKSLIPFFSDQHRHLD